MYNDVVLYCDWYTIMCMALLSRTHTFYCLLAQDLVDLLTYELADDWPFDLIELDLKNLCWTVGMSEKYMSIFLPYPQTQTVSSFISTGVRWEEYK